MDAWRLMEEVCGANERLEGVFIGLLVLFACSLVVF